MESPLEAEAGKEHGLCSVHSNSLRACRGRASSQHTGGSGSVSAWERDLSRPQFLVPELHSSCAVGNGCILCPMHGCMQRSALRISVGVGGRTGIHEPEQVSGSLVWADVPANPFPVDSFMGT